MSKNDDKDETIKTLSSLYNSDSNNEEKEKEKKKVSVITTKKN
jgi:hypothetical protein